MERVCTCCNKIIQNDEAALFCPYCGTSLTQVTMLKDYNIAWKIETTWGNQASYADKVKRIGRDLLSHIRTWTAEQQSFLEDQKSTEFVTAHQLRDDFTFLHASSGAEELEQEYRSFLSILEKVCHGEKNAENKSCCLC